MTVTTSPITALAAVEAWAAQALPKAAAGALSAADIDALLASARAASRRVRQRLLYLHAVTPSLGAPLVGAALHEPRPGGVAQMDPMQPDPPYHCVHDAVLDGWQVVHFPDQRAPFDDREIDVLGYEFVLQKLEAVDE